MIAAMDETEADLAEWIAQAPFEYVKYVQLFRPDSRQLRWERTSATDGQGRCSFRVEGLGEFDLYATVTRKAAPVDTPEWVMRTWVDVREGDLVRMPGTEATADVLFAMRRDWHVDPSSGTSGYNPPRPLEWSGVKLGLRLPTGEIYHIEADPAKPVEISLLPAEVAAIEAIGWESRVRQR